MTTVRRLCLAAVGVAVLLGGCRRREPTKVEIFDETATPAETEAMGALAPPWPAPERSVLANGLLVHWLHEADTPAAHVRLLVPTHGLKPAHQGIVALAAARALTRELELACARLSVRIELHGGLDRLEIAIHSPAAELPEVLATFAEVLATAPTKGLAQVRRLLARELRPLDADALAANLMAATLRGDPPEIQRASHADLASLDDAAVLDAFKALFDPRQAVLIVHAPNRLTSSAMTAASETMAERWRQRVALLAVNEARAEPLALRRLRPSRLPKPGTGHLVRAPVAELQHVDAPGRGRPVVVIGRAIPLADARERALARLAQRWLQERFDARLSIAGTWAAWTVHIPLAGRVPVRVDPLETPKDPEDPPPEEPLAHRVQRQVSAIHDRTLARPTTQELFQMAQLWLGARMVAASLDGEDWTALWSESLDLAGDDGEIAGAMARDAQTMLAATPEDLVAWQQRWLDPSGPEPGWTWVLVGSAEQTQGLATLLQRGLEAKPTKP